MLARHLERQYAAAQKDRADRVATQQAWVERECLLNLVIAWRGGWFSGKGHGLRVPGGGLQVVAWWFAVCGLTNEYAMTISATDMRKRSTSTMTN